jgi:hypothetical protein
MKTIKALFVMLTLVLGGSVYAHKGCDGKCAKAKVNKIEKVKKTDPEKKKLAEEPKKQDVKKPSGSAKKNEEKKRA